MLFRTFMKIARATAALALTLSMVLATSVGFAAPQPPTEDRFYIMNRGNGRAEIVDRFGNTPESITRPLREAWRCYDYNASDLRVAGYILHAVTSVPPEEIEEDGNYNGRSEAAFMLLDGTMLFDFARGASYYCPQEGIIVQEITQYESAGDWYGKQTASNTLTVANLITGQRTVLPNDTYINTISKLIDGWGALVYDIVDGFVEFSGMHKFIIYDNDFNVIKTLEGVSATLAEWEGQEVIFLYKSFGYETEREASIYNTQGEVIFGPFTEGYFSTDENGIEQLNVSDDAGRAGIVDKKTGAIVWHDGSTAYGDLRVVTRTATNAEGRYTDYFTVTDEAGNVVIPEREGNARLTEKSPILVHYYGNTETSTTVYDRKGNILFEKSQDIYSMSGFNIDLLSGHHAIYIVEDGIVTLYLPEGKQTSFALPEGTSNAWLNQYGSTGNIVIDFYIENAERSDACAAILKPDYTGLIEPWYFQIYPADYDVPEAGYVATQYNSGRWLMGAISPEGEAVVPCMYSSLSVERDLYGVVLGRYYGLLDRQGNWVIRRNSMDTLLD